MSVRPSTRWCASGGTSSSSRATSIARRPTGAPASLSRWRRSTARRLRRCSARAPWPTSVRARRAARANPGARTRARGARSLRRAPRRGRPPPATRRSTRRRRWRRRAPGLVPRDIVAFDGRGNPSATIDFSSSASWPTRGVRLAAHPEERRDQRRAVVEREDRRSSMRGWYPRSTGRACHCHTHAMAKVAIIGAGSVEFTRNVLTDLSTYPELAGRSSSPCTTSTRSGSHTRSGPRCRWSSVWRQATGDRPSRPAGAFDGADYLINEIQVGGYRATVTDFEIPARHGVSRRSPTRSGSAASCAGSGRSR